MISPGRFTASPLAGGLGPPAAPLATQSLAWVADTGESSQHGAGTVRRMIRMTTARAGLLYGPGEHYKIESVELDDPSAGEVLIDVKACGMCHSDEHARTGDLPMPHYPVICGHEGAGEVVAVGTGVTDLRVGDTWPPPSSRRAGTATGAAAGGPSCATTAPSCSAWA